MNYKVTLLLLLFNLIGLAQTKVPFYEQISFDFYKTEILDSFPVKKKIKVYKYYTSFHPKNRWFETPDCFQDITLKSNDQFKVMEPYLKLQRSFQSNEYELDFSKTDKKQFKIKKYGKGDFPKLFISPPHHDKSNRVL